MKVNTKLLNIQYSVMMAAYWGIVCVICGGFASVFLLSRDFTNTQVGLTVAVGNILGVAFQPYLASIADAAKKISLHILSVIMAVVIVAGFIALYFVQNPFALMAIIFVISFSLIQMLQSFTNSISLYYINKGININFGIARGMGSVFYAILSAVLGMMIDRFDENILLIVGVVLTAILIICILTMPRSKNEISEDTTKKTNNEQSFLKFIKKYKGFPLFLVGVMFLFIFHTTCNVYLIQIVERVGGTAENMGTALAIAAIVELPAMGLFSLLAKKFKSRQFILFAGVVFVVKAVAFLLAPNVVALYFCHILQFGCYGIYIPASVFYVNEMMDEGDTVKGQALIISAQTLGGVFASMLGGAIIDKWGTFALLILQVITAVIGAILLFLSPNVKSKIE